MVNVWGNRLLEHEYRNEEVFTYDVPHRMPRGGVVLVRVTDWLDVNNNEWLRGDLRSQPEISPATVRLFVWLGEDMSACR